MKKELTTQELIKLSKEMALTIFVLEKVEEAKKDIA